MLRQAFWCCCLIVLVLSLPTTGGSDMDLSGFWGKVQISATFAALTVLGLIAYPGSPRWVVIGLIAMGLLIELIQSFAPWQYAEPDDLLAVMTGIIIVRVVWVVAFRR
jgi:VanZ family protein